ASAPEHARSRSSTTSSSGPTLSSRRRFAWNRWRSSRPNSAPRSRASTPAIFARRRTSSSARAVRRSTSSAQDRGSVVPMVTPNARSQPFRGAGPRSFVKEARKRVGPKRARIRPIIDRLAAAYPDATIALKSRWDLELLVAVMLSAQTTDVNVNRVTEKLFAKYRRPEDYLAVPPEELERDIFATGFYRQKAKALRGTMKMLIEEHGGEVPEDFDALLRLPGVARKTANVVSAE